LPEPEAASVTKMMRALATNDGRRRQRARIMLQLETPGATRDQVSACLGRQRCVKQESEEGRWAELLVKVESLERSNRELEERLGGQRGGVVRVDDAPAFGVPESPAAH
jgi:hypothetical protein